MAQSRAPSMLPPFSVLPFFPALNSWGAPPPHFHPYPLGMPPIAPQVFPPNNMLFPEQGGFPPYPPRPTSHTYSQNQRYNNGPAHNPRQEPSTWVSSMAASSQNPSLDFWDEFAPAAPAPPPVEPSPPPAPPPPPPAPLPVKPAPALPPPPPAAVKPAVPKKPVSLIIGMNPDQDRHSKHGTFNPSAHTITSLTAHSNEAYIPNPARTIVMEQLPKTHRTRDFIKTWSKGACGAHPVYFAVDPASAKALIEFATAELARKAWGSPKLGGGVAGPPDQGQAARGFDQGLVVSC